MISIDVGYGNTFQSTLPKRGVTLYSDVLNLGPGISIHTPQAGSDCAAIKPLDIRLLTHFFANLYETPPCSPVSPYLQML